MRLHSLLVALAVLGIALPALAIDIIDVHQNDATGVPTMMDEVVTVRGVVTSPNFTYSLYNLEIYLQDATAGVNVWVSGGAASYVAELGDSITVTARVDQYNGLTELGTSTGETTITNHGPGSGLPDPLIITCAELNATFLGDYSEPDEGRLIRINDVSIVGGDPWPITPQSSNSFIDISDGTDTALLFIDKDTTANGSPDPGAVFDVIGILKQFDSSSPYTDGYEIVPRFASDVLTHESGPPIVGLPEVIAITENSATIYFETSSPGSSEIEWGVDDSYGNTAGDPLAEETEHTVEITGLDPNSVYHFRAKSSDGEGTRYGPDQLLATANDQPGELHVYMSFTADHDYADEGNEVPVMMGLSSLLTVQINQADYSVDACLYSFSLNNVRDALVNAHNRGCLVCIIIDENNSSAAADYCASHGIPYITSAYGGNHGGDGSDGIMHNKFVTIDARDADPYNDWVWTGSANMSISGNDDVNNAVKIQDAGLAQAYTLEFNEMWGSDTQTPNSTYARMGRNKVDDTPHEFLINGLRVQQYMSPSDGTHGKITEAMETADHSVYFAILAFTNYNLSDAMYDHRAALGGDLEIRGVFDEGLGDCYNGSVYYQMAGDPCSPYAWDIPADVWIDTPLPGNRLLHHKYMIVDVNWVDDDPLVVTGSHNWSFSADSSNDENTLIIHDQSVANMYLQEFAARYHESGGSEPLGELTAVGDWVPSGDRLLGAVQSYPNPFNPFTNIAFATAADADVTVKIFDVSGRLVRVLKDGEPMGGGYHLLGWDGLSDAGVQVPSGAYIAGVWASNPLTGHNEKGTKKLLVVQ